LPFHWVEAAMNKNYDWLRNKRPSHIEKLRMASVGNQNAKTHGLYSRTPPAMVCNVCPNIRTCPYYGVGKACFFVWQAVEKMEKKLELPTRR
jgi:hypothetical protein